jgi:hypothetical protein
MGLQIKIRINLRGIVQKDIVHRHIVGAEMPGAPDQLHGGKEAAHAIHHRFGVSINQHGFNFRDSQQSFDDVMKKRFAREWAVIFAGHALTVVAHGDKGGEFHVPYFTPAPWRKVEEWDQRG